MSVIRSRGYLEDLCVCVCRAHALSLQVLDTSCGKCCMSVDKCAAEEVVAMQLPAADGYHGGTC